MLTTAAPASLQYKRNKPWCRTSVILNVVQPRKRRGHRGRWARVPSSGIRNWRRNSAGWPKRNKPAAHRGLQQTMRNGGWCRHQPPLSQVPQPCLGRAGSSARAVPVSRQGLPCYRPVQVGLPGIAPERSFLLRPPPRLPLVSFRSGTSPKRLRPPHPLHLLPALAGFKDPQDACRIARFAFAPALRPSLPLHALSSGAPAGALPALAPFGASTARRTGFAAL